MAHTEDDTDITDMEMPEQGDQFYESLDNMGIDQLKDKATELGVTDTTGMGKAELINAIEELTPANGRSPDIPSM
jgi:hypothetical protein